jgi:hypothetical protein
MDLRTTIKIEPSENKITYNDPVMFIGSCFASSIGSQMEIGKMPVLINPAGSVYNPVSVCNTIDIIVSGRNFIEDDLYCFNGTWLSFNHCTDFSSEDPLNVIKNINIKSKEALSFLSSARFLFITLGTARVFRFKETGEIVSNCHKLPSDYFTRELLTVNDIVTLLSKQLDRIHSLFPHLQVVFTISPVRHWKDGAHGNQVSKSVLFLAVEELLTHPVSPLYFPAYELVMDDLRDYRFYNDDMLHPSAMAVKYIWEAFCGCFIDSPTLAIWTEVSKITKAVNHQVKSDSISKRKDFAERMLSQISAIEARLASINFSSEKKYFLALLNN